MLEVVIYAFTYLFEVLSCFMFLENVYYRKEDIGAKFYISYILAFVATYGVSFLSIPLLNMLTFVICYFLIALICYETKIKNCIFTTLTLAAFMLVTEMIVVHVSSALLKVDYTAYQDNLLILVIQTSLSKLLFFVLLFLISKVLNLKAMREKTYKYSFALSILPISSAVILHSLSYLGINSPIDSHFNKVLAVGSMLLLFANILVFYIYETVQKVNYENLLLQLEKQSIEIRTEYYGLLADEYEKSRVLIHDIKNHLRYIETKTADGSPQEVFDYIDSIREDFGLNEKIRYSGSSIIDVIINRYHNQCKEAGVTFEVEAFCSKLDFMADNDIIALLDNMFDNGFEAAIKSEDKRMMLSAYIRNDDYISIEMKNSSDKAPLSIAGKLVTTKGNPFHHGYGTKSIRRVLRKYDGTFKWSYDTKEHLFTAKSVVKKKNMKRKHHVDIEARKIELGVGV